MKRQKNVYLTVDLDYWYKPGMRKNIDFIKELLALDRPTTVYTEHQLILREIKRQYKKIINVDYHSDISQREPGWPNCGDWANFVHGRENAEFEWRMPDWNDCVTLGEGLCHSTHSEYSQYNPFLDNNLHTWKDVERKQGLRNLPLDDVDRISLILSPEWSPEWSIGDNIADTLLHIVGAEATGQVKFHGHNVQPLIKRMIQEGGPFYNWY